jgi:hypothetical protein
MKNILILGALIIVVMGLILVLSKPKEMSAPDTTMNPLESSGVSIDQSETTTPGTLDGDTTVPPPDKLKADTFTGTLTKVDTGCFADGECYVEVDGKKVTAIIGFSQELVGSVIGVDGFGDLESHIGKTVEVYAQDNSDGTYTLYGNQGFYIKVI